MTLTCSSAGDHMTANRPAAPLLGALELWVSPPQAPLALRYTRPTPTQAWSVTALVATGTALGSVWAKRLAWRQMGSPTIPGALLWTRPPTTSELELAYDDGQLVDLLTAQDRGLPLQPMADPDPVTNDPEAPRLVQVAAIYTTARNAGRPPVLAVATHFHVTRSTAVNWVWASRIAGHLPPATRGRAT